MDPEARFTVEMDIIDGNPFVLLPPVVLREVFLKADCSKGPIPVRGTVNGTLYQQTLMNFRGKWRLYVNMKMLRDSPRRIGEAIEVTVSFDPSDRTIEPHPKLIAMLDANPVARKVFYDMAPSRQKEIVRYIDSLKNDESADRNVLRAREFLVGKGRFVGRDSPQTR